MMLAVFNDQGIDVTLPNFPEQPTAFAVNVQHGVGAEGPPYATAEATMRAVYDLLVGADLDCAEFGARWISCDVSGWNIHVIDIDGPIIGPAGSRITISVVPQSPDSS